MTRLSDTQTVLLSTAAARSNHALLPIPDSVTTQGAALDRALKVLINRGFAEQMPVAAEGPAWRQNEDGQHIGLRATAAGLDAIGIGVEPEDTPNIGRPIEPDRPSGKLGLVLEAIEAETGATIEELPRATGWQAHTTRAAITRLRQRGFDVVLVTTNGRRAYHLGREG